jgi:DNA-binding response OmpR family regulator
MNASSSPSIVLVEDDLRLSELVRTYLLGNGFRVSVENRGDRVAERVQRENPDLVILDLGLPGQDGFSVCRELRSSSSVPILILTARNNDIDHVVGLELGADDYVIKPVEPRVLVARIQALLRRGRASAAVESKPLRFGTLSINATSRSVTLNEQPVPLSSNEFDLLFLLASRAGSIQSRENLYQQLYKRDYDGLDRTLDVRISHLRRKLGDTGAPEKIRTVWGRGYLFVPDVWDLAIDSDDDGDGGA